ncbi:hypothetical protein PT115_09130, partial [Erysipelothrix rhusiopathiae]|nr:hypothetical protein [Erysipelothrix rhusiopathiae]
LGLIMMLIQLSSLGIIFGFWICIRQFYDQGEGLVELLQTLGISKTFDVFSIITSLIADELSDLIRKYNVVSMEKTISRFKLFF